MEPELDIVIPVYNEGRNIVATLSALARAVKTPARVLICYDRPEDDTLPAIRSNPDAHAGLPVEFVRNAGRGARSRRGRCVLERIMAPRANWKGYLKLSLVSCAVELYPSSTTKDRVTFHMVNRETGNRLRRQLRALHPDVSGR